MHVVVNESSVLAAVSLNDQWVRRQLLWLAPPSQEALYLASRPSS